MTRNARIAAQIHNNDFHILRRFSYFLRWKIVFFFWKLRTLHFLIKNSFNFDDSSNQTIFSQFITPTNKSKNASKQQKSQYEDKEHHEISIVRLKLESMFV